MAIDTEWQISQDELGFEFMMNALRLTEGFDIDLFQLRTGLPIQHIEKTIKTAKEKALIEINQNIIKPTIMGQRFLNELLQLFLK